MKRNWTEDKVIETLNLIYKRCLKGLPGLPSPIEEANDYLNEYDNLDEIIKQVISVHKTKSGTTGFFTNMAGFMTFPISMPSNLISLLYIQIRMIMIIAYLNGFDILNDKIKPFVFLCLSGKKAISIVEEFGFDLEDGIDQEMILMVPNEIGMRINKAIVMQLISNLSGKTIENMVNMIPVAGGVLAASLDMRNTSEVAKITIKVFGNK